MTTSVPATSASRRGGRLGYVVIGAITAIFAVGWAVVMANVGQSPGISEQTITYRVLSDSAVEIRYSVANSTGDDVRCVVDAYDTDFAILAEKQVVVPAGSSGVTRTETLRTPRRATGARVDKCRKV